MFRCIVLVPSYNSGTLLCRTVRAVLAVWADVVVVIDGSTDGSGQAVEGMVATYAGLHVLHLPHNGGKGGAVLHGAEWALQQGYTHVLTMDADGQHPVAAVQDFVEAARRAPQAMVLGVPMFGPDAPALRVWGRKLSNILVQMETQGAVRDGLFGFRVYPAQQMVSVLRESRFMRGFDFDPEVAVRMVWRGVRTLNKPASVQYFDAAQGGISHFHYVRDNVRLIFMHLRLLCAWTLRARCKRR